MCAANMPFRSLPPRRNSTFTDVRCTSILSGLVFLSRITAKYVRDLVSAIILYLKKEIDFSAKWQTYHIFRINSKSLLAVRGHTESLLYEPVLVEDRYDSLTSVLLIIWLNQANMSSGWNNILNQCSRTSVIGICNFNTKIENWWVLSYYCFFN